MVSKLIIPVIFLILTLLIGSCKEQEEYHTQTKIVIENWSDTNIDSLKIYSFSSSYNLKIGPILFNDIMPGARTESQELEDLEIELIFKAYVGHDSIDSRWTCPHHFIRQSSKPILMPSGVYEFSILGCNMENPEFVIGLIEYY